MVSGGLSLFFVGFGGGIPLSFSFVLGRAQGSSDSNLNGILLITVLVLVMIAVCFVVLWLVDLKSKGSGRYRPTYHAHLERGGARFKEYCSFGQVSVEQALRQRVRRGVR